MSAYHKNALRPGSVLADYSIESMLGHGGFSITYLARDTALGADVAIKEYLPQEIAVRDGATACVIPRADRDAIRHYHWGLKSFVKEARALARFKHPNIVRVLRFIEANGTAYTVMEYERGRTLAQFLKEKGQRLDETDLLRIVMPILNGLHAVHEVGLLHLDIKPENIYLREDGTPMLIDFGSARHAMTENRPTGRVTLTHGYAPVEQYPDKGKLGPWSDVYALGATMYRCVTGKRPDDALNRYRALLDYKTDPLRPAVKAAAGRCQPLVLECIDRALQVHAKDRPQSAREFQDYLLGRSKLPQRATGSSAAVARSGERRWLRRLGRGLARVARVAVALVLLGAAAVGGWYAWPHLPGLWQSVTRSIMWPDAEDARRRALPASTTTARAPARTLKPAPRRESKREPDKVAPTPSTVSPAEALQPPSVAAGVLPGHADWVQAIAFAPNGEQLASAGADRTIRLWDMRSQTSLAVLRYPYAVNAVSFSADGNVLAAAGADGAVQLWDTRTGGAIGRFEAASYPLFSVAYAANGGALAAAGKDRVVYVWTLGDGTRRAFEGHTDTINAVAFRPGSNVLASAGADREIRLWDVASGHALATLAGHKDAILALAFSADGRWLASGDAGRAIRVWDMRSGSHVHTFTDSAQAVLSLAFGPGGAWLAAGSADHSVHIFDLESERLVQTLSGHGDYVQAVAVAPDGGWLASGGRDQLVRLWRAP